MNPITMLKDVTDILKLKNPLILEKPNKEINHDSKNGERFKSFIPSILYVGQLYSKKNFIGNSVEDETCVYQWLEYYLLKFSHMESKEVLIELNLYLKDYVYLVKENYTIADLVMYLRFHEIFSKLSFQEKEAYPNLSRWFRNVQKEVSAFDLYPKVTFSKTKLYIK